MWSARPPTEHQALPAGPNTGRKGSAHDRHGTPVDRSLIPSPPDPELDFGEYYVLDIRDRPVKVRVVNIAPHGDRTVYQVETPSGRLVHGCWETDTETWGGGWYAKAHLYDNKDDCRSSTHLMYDEWERLREMQRKEQRPCTEI